jgi:tetratricopeptide (TPR) repeat protein
MQKRFQLALPLVALLALPLRLSALDFALSVSPNAFIPISSAYTVGGGGGASFNTELLDWLSAYGEAGFEVAPILNSSMSLSLVNGGGGLRLVAYPLARLKLDLGLGGGLYGGFFGTESRTDLYWKAGLGAGYRLSPGVSILADAAWMSYYQASTSLLQSVSAGVKIDISLGVLGNRNSGLRIEELGGEQVYPIQYQSYAKRALGKVRITNTEQAELRNIRVSFSMGEFTAEAAPCATIAYLARGASVEVPLYAIFNTGVLSFTESTKIQGSLKLDYELLGAPQTMTRAESVSFLHRNAFTWRDPSIMGAFVLQNDPSVLEYSKYIAGLVRDRLRPDLDKELQFGMGLFEGLRLFGLKCAADPSTPYAVWHKKPDWVDYLQYPYQTLSYKGGDSDDLAVLYAAALESVGVSAAFIPLDDEVLVACRLDQSEAQARSSFYRSEDLIFMDGAVWVPVAVSRIREGFLAAWQEGAEKWRGAQAGGKAVCLIVDKAWEAHPPVGLTDIDYRAPRPEAEQVNLAFENAMSRFVAKEAEPRAQRLISDMGKQGTGKQYNSLGILYAKYGLLQKAFDAFSKASELGYGSAFTNLANVAFLQKNFEAAITYYESALKLKPDNTAALIGLARAKYEVDAYADADELYAKVLRADPALANRYAYLSSQVAPTTARASSAAADRGGDTAWAEEP